MDSLHLRFLTVICSGPSIPGVSQSNKEYQRYSKLSIRVVPNTIGLLLTGTWLTSYVLNAGIGVPRYLNLNDIIIHSYSMELQKHWLSSVIEIRNSIYSDHKTIICGLLMKLIEYIYHQMTWRTYISLTSQWQDYL